MANVYEAFSFGDATITGKVLGDLTIDYCKTMMGIAVSQVGMILTELGVGDYVLMNPNITMRTVIRGHLTSDATKRFVVMMDPVDGNIAQQSVLTIVQGLVMFNHVEDNIVRDTNGLKTASTLYLYDTSAHAIAHDKVTGLICAPLMVNATYTNKLLSLFKVVSG